jgi:hypothetical protein
VAVALSIRVVVKVPGSYLASSCPVSESSDDAVTIEAGGTRMRGRVPVKEQQRRTKAI